MKIVVTGLGQTGTYLADILIKEGHDLVFVEKNEKICEQARERLDAKIVPGDAASALTLEPLVDDSVHLFIALTDSDQANTIGTLIARKFGAKRAIVRMSDPENLIHPLLTDDPCVSVLNAEMIVSKDLARLVGNPSADEIEFFANGKAEMAKFHVTDDAPIVYKELRNVEIPKSWLLIAAIHDGKFSIVSGETVIRPGDQVLAVGDAGTHKVMEELLGLHSEKVKRVILTGANAISIALAQSLRKRDIEVRLIEEDKNRATQAAAELDGVLVLQGDGTSDEILEQAGVDQADYLIALTDDDENNVLTSLVAKEKGVKRVVTLTEKHHYKRIVEKIGIDSVVNQRSAMVDEVIRCIHYESLSGINILEGGQGRFMEFVIQKKTKIVDVPLAKVKLPKHILIGAVIRSEKIIIPRGADRIKVGDHILVFSTLSAFSEVQRLFAS